MEDRFFDLLPERSLKSAPRRSLTAFSLSSSSASILWQAVNGMYRVENESQQPRPASRGLQSSNMPSCDCASVWFCSRLLSEPCDAAGSSSGRSRAISVVLVLFGGFWSFRWLRIVGWCKSIEKHVSA